MSNEEYEYSYYLSASKHNTIEIITMKNRMFLKIEGNGRAMFARISRKDSMFLIQALAKKL
jgi:hypothetical protein